MWVTLEYLQSNEILIISEDLVVLDVDVKKLIDRLDMFVEECGFFSTLSLPQDHEVLAGCIQDHHRERRRRPRLCAAVDRIYPAVKDNPSKWSERYDYDFTIIDALLDRHRELMSRPFSARDNGNQERLAIAKRLLASMRLSVLE